MAEHCRHELLNCKAAGRIRVLPFLSQRYDGRHCWAEAHAADIEIDDADQHQSRRLQSVLSTLTPEKIICSWCALCCSAAAVSVRTLIF